MDTADRRPMYVGTRTASRVRDFGSLVCLAVAGVLVATRAHAQQPAVHSYTSPLSTGARLDPVGRAVDLGNMPLAMALAPHHDKLVVALSGWRQQGLQIVDLASRRVTQTLEQPAAFYGLAFSPNGRELYVSGGNEDAIYCYSWNDSAALFQRRIVLGTQKADKTGSRYPAGIAFSTRGSLLYVAENVADSLAVVDPASSRVVQRFATDHYPYAVAVAPDGMVYVSAWGSTTVSMFHENGRRPAALRRSLARRSAAIGLALERVRLPSLRRPE